MSPEERKEIDNLVVEAKKLADDKMWLDAADVMIKAMKIRPDDIRILDDLGWYLSRSKRYQESINIYKRLLQMEPALAKWPYMIGYQYYDQGQWREAIKWFDQALTLRGNYPVVHYRKGYAHLQLNEGDLAKSSFDICLSIWHSLNDDEKQREAKAYSNACFQLGKYYLANGQTRNAEKILSQSIKYGPQDAHKHYNYGKALLRNGESKDALEQFKKADRIEPQKDYILDYIARAQIELEQYDEAENTLEKIPKKRLKHYHWCNLGNLWLIQDNPKKAVQALKMATQLQPNNHNYHFALAQAYEKNDEIRNALNTYKRAIDIRKRTYGLEFPEAQQRLTSVEKIANEKDLDINSEDLGTLPNGFIKVYKAQRGFGFINRSDGEDLFFHVSEVKNPDAISIGSGVVFKIEESPKGSRATEISVLES